MGLAGHFSLALEILQSVGMIARKNSPRGLRLSDMADALHIEHRHAQQVLDALHDLKWIGENWSKPTRALKALGSCWSTCERSPLAPLVDTLVSCIRQRTQRCFGGKCTCPTIKVADVMKLS
jgi:membrane protein